MPSLPPRSLVPFAFAGLVACSSKAPPAPAPAPVAAPATTAPSDAGPAEPDAAPPEVPDAAAAAEPDAAAAAEPDAAAAAEPDAVAAAEPDAPEPDAAGPDFATLVTSPTGRAAIFDALDQSPALAAPAEPRADGWAGWKEDGGPAWAAGVSADGQTVVLGDFACDHQTCTASFEARAVGAVESGRDVEADEATRLAPPLAPMDATAWKGDGDHLAYTRVAGVSVLASSGCRVAKDAGEEFYNLDCTWRVEARAPGHAPVELAQVPNTSVAHDQSTRFYTRPGGSTLVAVWHICAEMEGCPPRAHRSFALPRDAVRAYNAEGLARLEDGALVEAQRAFEAALALDAAAELPRYNLACAHARQGHAAEAATALEPLVAATPKKWRAKVKDDPDFASVRTAPEIQALLAP